MAHKLWFVFEEGSCAEDMVGVDMGQHYVANRQLRCFADGCAQILAVEQAAAGVHDADGFAAYDEADVGDGVVVGCGRIFVQAAAEVDAGGDFTHGRAPMFAGWKRPLRRLQR